MLPGVDKYTLSNTFVSSAMKKEKTDLKTTFGLWEGWNSVHRPQNLTPGVFFDVESKFEI